MKSGRTARLTATVFGLGDLLPAPGTTAGSLPAALVWFVAVLVIPDPRFDLVATVVGVIVATIAGLWAAEEEVRRRGLDDPGPVVIDEVAGQWLCYLVALPYITDTFEGLVIFTVLGFFLFRFFDIVKPWPANRLEKLHGGLGIMADDLAAGLYAGFCLIMISYRQLFIGWLRY